MEDKVVSLPNTNLQLSKKKCIFFIISLLLIFCGISFFISLNLYSFLIFFSFFGTFILFFAIILYRGISSVINISIKLEKKYMRNYLIIKTNFKEKKYSFENVKYFSNLKDNGKGIYLEFRKTKPKKILSYDNDDSIIERAILELNYFLERLKEQESLDSLIV